jgi:hypothetical protein
VLLSLDESREHGGSAEVGQIWTPITPESGSILHADSQYDRETDEIRIQQPINTCVIGHFYTMEDAEGRKRFELEQLLSEYESKANVAINKLTSKQPICAEERSDLAIFTAFAACRTPDLVESVKHLNSEMIMKMSKLLFNDIEIVKDKLRRDKVEPVDEAELEHEAKDLVEFAKSGQYKVVTEHKWAVGMAMQMAFDIATILAGRNWNICHRDNDKASFITTDAPVLLTTVEKRENTFFGVGFGNADALVLFPLNQSCVLAIHGEDGLLTHRNIDKNQIRRLNLALTSKCQRFVIGRDETLIKSLVEKVDLANTQWIPKMRSS